MSVGAAMFDLHTMLASGRMPVVRLLPVRGEPDVVATVSVGPPVAVSADVRTLADAIALRRTNRRPFWSARVPDDVLAAVTDAAEVEGASLDVLDPPARAGVLSAVRSAEVRLRADEGYRAELAGWAPAAAGRDDGVPAAAIGPRPQLAALPVRDFDLGYSAPRRVAPFESEPTIAVLYTRDDTARGWLVAGQALQRTLLTATIHRVAVAPMTQVIAVPEVRDLLGSTDESWFAQSVLRLGYAGAGPGAPAARSPTSCSPEPLEPTPVTVTRMPPAGVDVLTATGRVIRHRHGARADVEASLAACQPDRTPGIRLAALALRNSGRP